MAAALCAPVAGATDWPVAGGDASRSGARSLDAGEAPITPAWSAPATRVRTPILITGGGGPSEQRVAYATSSGRLHLRVLATGKPVGPPDGTLIEGGQVLNEQTKFGSGNGAIGLLDTSTEDRLGILLLVHNDEGAVYITRVDPANAEVLGSAVVASTLGCSINSSPLLTPPDSKGGRVLFFTMTGACLGGTGLVRIPIENAASRNATIGDRTFAPRDTLSELASPSLAVLRDQHGTPKYYVAVARSGGLDLHDASKQLDPATPPAVQEPEIRAELADPAEIPLTPSAPATASGAIAGSQGSATGPAAAIYVATNAGGQTRVHKLVQDGNAQSLRVAASAGPLPNAGAPAPGLAVSEVVDSTGSKPGHVVVTSAGNVTVLRTGDLVVTGQLSPAALGGGQGFGSTVPAISGPYAYLQRSGAADAVPEHLVIRVATGARVGGGEFAQAGGNSAGTAFGQPAIARGWVVLGSAAGAFAYRNRDVTPPVVELGSVPSTLSGTVDLVAHARDARGIGAVAFRLVGGGTTRTVATSTAPAAGDPFTGSARFVGAVATASLPNGEYFLDAVAADTGGNTAITSRKQVRVSNAGGDGLPRGACLRTIEGSAAPDKLTGSSAGDRIVGGAGDDRLDGAGGHDCVLGQGGDDVVAGGSGNDLLDGGVGEDTLVGGAGVNRLDGGSGADVLRGGRGSERLLAGSGHDTVLAGSGKDRVEGGSGNDSIRGEAGNDILKGGAGNDSLSGGPGTNRYDGGTGNDRISAVNGRRERIRCGKGRDSVTADYRDRVDRTCERVRRVTR